MRPASASSIRAICRDRTGRPVARTSSSMSTGAGPSAASSRARSCGADLRRAIRSRAARDFGSGGLLCARRAGGGLACQHRCQGVDDVFGLGGHRGPVLEEAVGALGARIERMARHGEHLAPLVGGRTRGDQRSRSPRRLHDQHAQRDSPEMMRLRRGKSWARGTKPGGVLADQAATLADLALQLGMLRRIDVVEAAGEHRDGAVLERRLVGRRVDAAGEPGGDDVAGAADARRRTCGRASGRPPSRCGRRRWPPSGASGGRRRP